MTEPHALTASDALARIQAGTLSVEDLARSCLARIAAREPYLRAWAWIEPDAVVARARELDKQPVKGPLHGLPIGVKDMIQTRDMPTQHNSPIYVGHRPGIDAAPIETLRAAGALILGKTETVEFAGGGRKALTRHPFNPARTPGGTSTGSAAAVADLHVPVALGTQTAGSTIRPSSFCGVWAMKPTWGRVSREGVKVYSQTLDTLTWMTRAPQDLALLCEVFQIWDDAPAGAIGLQGARIGLCRSPVWNKAEDGTRLAFTRAATLLAEAGAEVVDLELPPVFARLDAAHTAVMNGEGRAAFLNEYRANYSKLHTDFREKVENALGLTGESLCAAYDLAASCRPRFDAIAREFTAVLTPSAPGEAPFGLHTTGDSVFNRMWSLLHVPCVNVPGLTGPAGLPVGVTVTGPRFMDRHVLQVAASVGAVLARG
jgi:Asp-tRNA(Asn)/Glu-tRNA(Gln) amidotransferase A subunit family amidase